MCINNAFQGKILNSKPPSTFCNEFNRSYHVYKLYDLNTLNEYFGSQKRIPSRSV